MQADFNFNLPHRQQAVSRSLPNYRPVPPPPPPSSTHRPRARHGCHVFCFTCLKRFFLGASAFKVYLLVAWCIGLAALMVLQQKPKRGGAGGDGEGIRAIYTSICLIYLLSQVSGLLAVVTQIERIFIPYGVVLVITTVANTVVISWSVVQMMAFLLGYTDQWDNRIFGRKPEEICVLSICFLVYNSLCLSSIGHLSTLFDQKRILAERRLREEIAHRARVYNLLVEQNNRDQPVTINVDSPPKYSSLTAAKSETICTPPPGYSQLKNYNNQEEKLEKKKDGSSHRSLFQDLGSDEKQ